MKILLSDSIRVVAPAHVAAHVHGRFLLDAPADDSDTAADS